MTSKCACLIMSIGSRYKKMGQVAASSFKKYNPDVDLFVVTEKEVTDYECYSIKNYVAAGVFKFHLAHEILSKGYERIIVIGSDTITCSRLDEFLDDKEHDILCTLDYPYQLVTDRISTPDSETHINADVVCFKNIQAIQDILSVCRFYGEYHEQGALNEIVWRDNKYRVKIVDYPYTTSKVVYNARAKGNIAAGPGQKPWKEYVQKYYVEDNRLFTHDHKQIKVFHYCEGFGAIIEEKFHKLMNWWIFECFNEETRRFFKEQCNSGTFFEERYEK